ncbi:MAG TPA: isopentenyl-diphosphate Delta-isomerase [Hyphomicrobium sp.]|nr:isopentenyl-diphosphate Delta-isomerase [Hyphomicrobium sp.]
MSSPEHVILIDAADCEVGVAEKLEAHRAGLLHRAFSVIIWDSRRRQLLQKRANSKYHSAGLWTNACCGHPRPGEAVAQAAARRLVEEMGFCCQLEELGTVRYRAALDNGLTEHEIVHVYRGVHDGSVRPDPAEAEAYDWRTLGEIRAVIAAAPERFTVWYRTYVAQEWPMALAPSLQA